MLAGRIAGDLAKKLTGINFSTHSNAGHHSIPELKLAGIYWLLYSDSLLNLIVAMHCSQSSKELSFEREEIRLLVKLDRQLEDLKCEIIIVRLSIRDNIIAWDDSYRSTEEDALLLQYGQLQDTRQIKKKFSCDGLPRRHCYDND